MLKTVEHKRKDTMTKKTSILIAMAGAALVAASQAQAQTTAYSQGDLLVNLRNPSSSSVPDFVVDLGAASGYNASTPLTVLDSSTTALWAGGAISGFTDAQLQTAGTFGGLPSSGNVIGMSAAADTKTGNGGNSIVNYWLTTPLSAAPTSTPTSSALELSISTAGTLVTAINNIGAGFSGGASPASDFTSLGAHDGTVVQGDTDSYQKNAADTSSLHSGEIDYNALEGQGIESTQNGSAAIYEALWDVQSKGNGQLSQTYEGWFTYYPDDEITFNGGVSAVPEPSTYGLVAGLSLLALALRRQFRSQLA
jgi:hypothetical protein